MTNLTVNDLLKSTSVNLIILYMKVDNESSPLLPSLSSFKWSMMSLVLVYLDFSGTVILVIASQGGLEKKIQW
jgi:hypothetical protein